jgi:methionine-rich copper-binding protein CopC
VAALALACSVLLAGPVAPTWAHAELISSNPVDGATLTSVPASAVLTFTDEIDPQFVRAAVTTPAATGLVQAATNKHVVTIPITSAGPGAYKVVYRVVSADGHPISGQLRFTVAGTPTATSLAGAAASEPSGTASPGAPAAAPPTASSAASDTASGSGTTWLLWAAMTLAVLAGVGAVLAAVRGRRS